MGNEQVDSVVPMDRSEYDAGILRRRRLEKLLRENPGAMVVVAYRQVRVRELAPEFMNDMQIAWCVHDLDSGEMHSVDSMLASPTKHDEKIARFVDERNFSDAMCAAMRSRVPALEMPS